MSKSLIFVYLISILLFSYQSSVAPNYSAWRSKAHCPWLASKSTNPKNETQALKKSFLCGNKKGLKRETKTAYKNLNLYHLFTPSGIHLGIFYILNRPLLKITASRSKKIYLIYKLLLSIWPWFLSGFLSLKRIGGMHLLKTLPLKFRPVQIFFLFFLFDYFFGTYKESPMSWSYSFLFLGIVFHTYQKSFLRFSLYLFSGQLLASIFSFQDIYPLSFLPSFILTAIFSPVFMITFFDNLFELINFSFLNSISNWVIDLFNLCVIYTNKFLALTPSIKPEIFALSLTLGLLIKSRKIIVLSLLLNSNRIYNLPDSRARQSAYVYQHDVFFNSKPINEKFDRRGTIKLQFSNKRTCSLKFFNYGKTKNCRFKKI